MQPFFAAEFGNASSVHTLGSHARVALEEARETIARAIHAEPQEIIFTSGGTESDNAAVKSVLFRHYGDHFGGTAWSDIEVVTSRAEHLAVIEPMEWMARIGARLTYVSTDSHGVVQLPALREAVTEKTALVSLMSVNNETGAINPVREIAKIVRGMSSAVFHCDAVQALGKIPIDVRELDADMLSLSAHKIHGPKGIGALYVRSGIAWEPLIHGGSQERNRRGGTEAVALAVGFAEAVRHVTGHEEHFRTLRSYLLGRLREIPEVVLNSATDDTSIDAIVNFSFVPEVLAKLDADALIIRFDLEGVAISNGAACTSGSFQPSHVLLACGRGEEIASKSVRVSFSRCNTIDDIDRLIRVVSEILH